MDSGAGSHGLLRRHGTLKEPVHDGNVTDIDLTQLFDESKSLAEGAITIPGYNADGWGVRIFSESGFLDPDKPIRKYTKKERQDFLHKEPTKVKVGGVNIQRMNELLLRLRDKGNTVLVVEHKPEMIAIADHVVDLGPGAGTAGGTVCFEGSVEGLRASGTLTGRHLGDGTALKKTVRTPTGMLEIRGWG